MSFTYATRTLPGAMSPIGRRSKGTQLFNIQHETGDLSEYDATVTDGGDLSASLSAGLRNSLTVIGSELITNGTFNDWTVGDPDGWVVGGESGSDPEVSEVGSGEGHGGVGTGACNLFTSTSSNIQIRQDITTEIGKTYQITYDVDTVTSGTIRATEEFNADFSEDYSTPGEKSVIFEASATTSRIVFKRVGSGVDVTIDNVSCKEVTGATYGMQCVVDDSASIYGRSDFSAPASGVLRARFYIDPSQLEMAEADSFNIFRVNSSVGTAFECRLNYNSGSYQVATRMLEDDLTPTISASVNITAGQHFIEMLMTQATTSSSNDGGITLFVDGAEEEAAAGKDNFDMFAGIFHLRLGAVASIDAGTRGHLYLDELVVRDDDKQIGA